MGEQGQSTVITIRLQRTLLERIDQIAKADDRSRNYTLVKLLVKAVLKRKAGS